MTEFMGWRHGTEFSNDHVFPVDQLGSIQPSELRRFFTFKVFGKEEITDADDPKEGRASSIEFWKKSISYYMPNRLHAWNSLRLEGNPTR